MGASDLGPPVDDTWTFDGTKWEHVCGASSGPACGPAARALASIAYQHQPDLSLQGAVMGGGGDLFTGGTQVLQRDAWIWRAGAWTQLATPWPATPVTFTDSDEPANGSGPLLALLAARPTQCQVLVVGQNPVSSGADVRNRAADLLRWVGPVFDRYAERLHGTFRRDPDRGARERLSADRGSGRRGQSQRTGRTHRSGQRSPGHHRRALEYSRVPWRSGGRGHTRDERRPVQETACHSIIRGARRGVPPPDQCEVRTRR